MINLTRSAILTLPADLNVLDAIDRINQAQTGFALVVDPCLVGIFTERHLFQAIATRVELAKLALADLMTRSPIALHESDAENLTLVLQQFQHHQLQYLPVVDDRGQPVGVISHDAVFEALQNQAEQAEAALWRSEQTNRLLLDANPNLVIRLRQDGTYLDFSPAKRFKSFTPDPNIRGKTISEVMPAVFAQERMWYVERALQTGTTQVYEFELEVEGERRYQEAQISVSGADEVLVVIRDITDRRQIEEALRESTNRFCEIAETVSQAFFVRSASSGEYLYVSPAYEKIWGRSCASLYQNPQSWLDDVHPDDRSIVSQSLDHQFQGNSVTRQYRIVHPDGSLRWIRVNVSLVNDAAGNPLRFVGVLEDITERQQAEEKLNESQRFVESIANASPNLIYVYDLIEQRNIYTNYDIDRILNYSSEEVQAMGSAFLPTIMHPEDFAAFSQHCQRMMAASDREILEFGYRMRHKNGKWRWFHSRDIVFLRSPDGRPKQILGAAMDITEQKRTEAKLRDSQYFIQSLMDASPNVLYLHDLLEQRNVYINREISQVLGYTPAEIQAMGSRVLQTLMHPEDFAAFGNHAQRFMIARDGEMLELDYRMRRKDGEWRWLHSWEIIFLRTAEGAPQQILGTAVDVTDRKQMEAALQQSEQRYRAIVEDQTELIVRYQTDTTLVFANESYCRYFGLDREKMIGHTYSPVIVADDRQHVTQLVQSLSAENPVVTIENRVIAPNGEIRWTQWINRVILDPQNQIVEFQAVGRDITDRKQIEIALQESEEKFRQLAAHIQDVFWIASPDGFSLYVSPAFEKVWGQSVAVVYHNPDAFFDSIHPDDRARVRHITSERNQQGGETDLEYRIIKPSGEIRWIHDRGFPICNASGQVYRVVGIASDITDWKLSEEALRQSEAQLRTLIENLPFSCWFSDATGRPILQNPIDIQRWGNMLGRTKDEFDLPQEIRERWQLQDQRALAGEIVRGEEQYLVGGELRTFFHIMAPVRSSDDLNQDTIHGIVGVSIDITDRKQAEESLQQAKEIAEAANRAKSEFLSRMSHELRTPLTSVLGFADLIAKDTDLSPEHQAHLAIIRRSGTHLLNLINSVLEMSRIEAGELTLNETSFDLHRLLEDIKDLFQLKAAAKGLMLSVSWNPDLPQHIQTDENKLRQVLINLLDNAIKFTETGRVALRVSRGQKAEGGGQKGEAGKADEVGEEKYFAFPLSPSFPPPPILLCFQIEDTGAGIAPDELTVLFNAFTQTEAGRKLQQGTGLGLAISRQFVQMMAGEIIVASQVGQGTTLTFTIQATLTEAHATPSSVALHQTVMGLATSATYRILIVDDQPETRRILARLLKPIGFAVQEAANGQEAVALWQSWQPHLIWMDMRMPIMDGYTATREIRDREQARMKDESGRMKDETKIIALTANAFDQQRSNALAAGCDDFLVKPFRHTDILQKTAEHLAVEYRYAENQPLAKTVETTARPAESLPPPSSDSIPSTLPATWRADLRDAALRLHSHQCLRLIEQIPETHRLLAQMLIDRVNCFQFDAIVDWVEQTGDR